RKGGPGEEDAGGGGRGRLGWLLHRGRQLLHGSGGGWRRRGTSGEGSLCGSHRDDGSGGRH
ncbi:MAG: hypothetical protein ACK53Y_24920, partial [bacterium]